MSNTNTNCNGSTHTHTQTHTHTHTHTYTYTTRNTQGGEIRYNHTAIITKRTLFDGTSSFSAKHIAYFPAVSSKSLMSRRPQRASRSCKLLSNRALLSVVGSPSTLNGPAHTHSHDVQTTCCVHASVMHQESYRTKTSGHPASARGFHHGTGHPPPPRAPRAPCWH